MSKWPLVQPSGRRRLDRGPFAHNRSTSVNYSPDTGMFGTGTSTFHHCRTWEAVLDGYNGKWHHTAGNTSSLHDDYYSHRFSAYSLLYHSVRTHKNKPFTICPYKSLLAFLNDITFYPSWYCTVLICRHFNAMYLYVGQFSLMLQFVHVSLFILFTWCHNVPIYPICPLYPNAIICPFVPLSLMPQCTHLSLLPDSYNVVLCPFYPDSYNVVLCPFYPDSYNVPICRFYPDR